MASLKDRTPDNPASVKQVADAIRGYVGRLGPVWVEGQLAQVSLRNSVAFLTLRDLATENSLQTIVSSSVLRGLPSQVAEGQRVIVQARPEFWPNSGDLRMRLLEVRAVGVGQLLADLERLKNLLAAEGLFAAGRKRPLPFLPRRVGLICGRASDAERDVVTNARGRWPSVQFEIREVPVQGTSAVSAVTAALIELDGIPEVDVIVIARGGGSVEDLLPFSNEALIRAVVAVGTPVVSAIGHEKDTPILDFVADLRASTPTDAGKRIVPDMAEEARRVREMRSRSARGLAGQLKDAERWLHGTRTRPSLATPLLLVERHSAEVAERRRRSEQGLGHRLERAELETAQLRARVRSLSPLSTLKRGYAVVQHTGGGVVRRATALTVDEPIHIRVAEGAIDASVIAIHPEGS